MRSAVSLIFAIYLPIGAIVTRSKTVSYQTSISDNLVVIDSFVVICVGYSEAEVPFRDSPPNFWILRSM